MYLIIVLINPLLSLLYLVKELKYPLITLKYPVIYRINRLLRIIRPIYEIPFCQLKLTQIFQWKVFPIINSLLNNGITK